AADKRRPEPELECGTEDSDEVTRPGPRQGDNLEAGADEAVDLGDVLWLVALLVALGALLFLYRSSRRADADGGDRS
ncbi:MAG: hypothetical protein QF464_16260, partial [Myxococcota bacterium]|nr:hypothetical protein [Myxococcota bacterium]